MMTRIFSRSGGAAIGAVGAVLVLAGALLPTYGSADYERGGGAAAPLLLVLMLGLPAFAVLAIGVRAWSRGLSVWFVVGGLVVVVIALVMHIFVSILSAAFACFDVCPPGGAYFGTGFWLPSIGFVLSLVGLAVVAANLSRRPSAGPR